jgi:translation initiation factor IF-3
LPKKNLNLNNSNPVNESIMASEVMLIDSDGKKLGIHSFKDAMSKAKEQELDLVQVSPSGAIPLVCKLLDYGKHIFDKKKNRSASRSKIKRNTTKEVKFRPSTDVGDYNIKLKKIKSFILDGDKTKISVRFRGREILNSDMGLNLLNRLRDDLVDIAQVDQDPSLEGRQLLMVLSPLKKKS